MNPPISLHDTEFKVFSQFGDNGIIQHLVQTVQIDHKIFIEFGVQDYKESNTHFLLMNNNWRGFVMDCSKEYIEFIKKEDIYWKHDLTADCRFITQDNINDIFKKYNFTGEKGKDSTYRKYGGV